MNSMRILTPEIKRIRERYKDDRAKMNQEMFAMYKEKKINTCYSIFMNQIYCNIVFAILI